MSVTRSRVFTVATTIVSEECCACHVIFGLGKEHRDELIKSQASFYCPNGHAQSYVGETEEQKLRRRLAAQQETTEHYRSRAEMAIRSRNALKGQVTKVKNRVAKGVCPCCNRSFPQLASHMESEHPGFVEAS